MLIAQILAILSTLCYSVYGDPTPGDCVTNTESVECPANAQCSARTRCPDNTWLVGGIGGFYHPLGNGASNGCRTLDARWVICGASACACCNFLMMASC